jgi:hypothetical protein
MKKLVAAAVLVATSVIATGCLQQQVNDRIKEYQALLDPKIGVATREDMIRQFGAPQDRQTVGSLEVWTYHMSFGSRGGAYISNPSQFGGFASTASREIYDRLTLTFEAHGYLKDWRVWVQR